MNEKTKQHVMTALGLLLVIVFIYYAGAAFLDKLSNLRILRFVSSIVAEELEEDSLGHTNILLLGVGGELHEGKDLTDTIIIASLNKTKGEAGLISIPRDLYVESTLGGMRVNRLYEKGKTTWESEQGLDFARDTLEEMFDIPIHYVMKIDFAAFEKIVDELGGIDVSVEQEINDPYYPKEGTFEYELFAIPKGLQHLDGKTALKYARSRKTSSDFDRSKRQHQVLLAIKEKAQQENALSRRSLLRELYSTLSEHIETDMSYREILSLAEFAAKWDSKNFSSAALNDEPIFRGGFLYTPVRELYGGAFVLLPAGDDFSSVQQFAKLTLYGPKRIELIPVAILNGTETSGLAAKMKSNLHRFGVSTNALGNARNQNLAKTTWYSVTQEAKPLLEYLIQFIPGEISEQVPQEYLLDPKLLGSKIILEIGADAAPIIEKLDIFKNIVLLVPPTQGTSTPQ